MRTLESGALAANRGAEFDLLRTRLESEVGCPAIVAVTSSTSQDGKEVVARALASSLSAAGYATLLLDTCLKSSSPSIRARTGTFEAELRRAVPERPSETLLSLAFGDASLQKSSSQRDIQAALTFLRETFDFVVVITEDEGSTSFAMSIISMADAVLVAVKTGRRQRPADARLSNLLSHIGDRFLGIVALGKATVSNASKEALIVAGAGTASTRNHGIISDKVHAS